MALSDAVAYAKAVWLLAESSGNRYPQFSDYLQTTGVSPSSASGKFGRLAASFTSGSNHFCYSDSFQPPTGDLTIWFWFKTTSKSRRIVGFNENPGNVDSGVADRGFWLDASGFLNWYVYDGAARTVTGAADLSDNAFHLVVGTIEGGTLKLYVDGSSVGTPIALTGGHAYNSYASPHLLIGKGPEPSGIGTSYDGLLQEVGLLDGYGLSSSEVTELWASSTGKSFLTWGIPAGGPTGYDYRLRLNYDLDGIPGSDLDNYPKRFDFSADRTLGSIFHAGGDTVRIAATDPDGTTEIPCHAENVSIALSVVFGTSPDTSTSGTYDLTLSSHTLKNGDQIQFQSAAPSGFSYGVDYFVVNAVAGVSFQLSLTRGGSPIATGGYPGAPPTMKVWEFTGSIRILPTVLLTSASVGDLMAWLYASSTATDHQDENGVWDGAGATPGTCEARLGGNSDSSYWYDSTSNGADGTLQNSVSISDGTATFDGTDDRIDVDLTGLGVTVQSATVLCVAYADTEGENPGYRFGRIFDFNTAASGYATGAIDDATRIHGFWSNDGYPSQNEAISGYGDFNLDTEYTVAYRGSGNALAVYVDGASVASASGGYDGDSALTTGAIGNVPSGTTGTWKGYFKEYQFWSVALAAEWIAYFDLDERTNSDTYFEGAWEEGEVGAAAVAYDSTITRSFALTRANSY